MLLKALKADLFECHLNSDFIVDVVHFENGKFVANTQDGEDYTLTREEFTKWLSRENRT